MKKRILFLLILFVFFMGYGTMNVKADVDIELWMTHDDDGEMGFLGLDGSEKEPSVLIASGITRKVKVSLSDIESYENIKSIQFSINNTADISVSNFMPDNDDFEVKKEGNNVTINVLNKNREHWSSDDILTYNVSFPTNPSKQTLRVGISNIKINYTNETSKSISNKEGYVFVVNKNLSKICNATSEISDGNTTKNKKTTDQEPIEMFETKSDKVTLKISEISKNSNVKLSKDATGSLSSDDSYINYNGPTSYNLNYGENTIIVICESEYGRQFPNNNNFSMIDKSISINNNLENYNNAIIWNVIRIDTRSAINTLNSLKVIDYNINFNKMVKFYNVTVPNNITSVKIESTLSDSKSRYENNYGNRTVNNLKVGNNSILIKVISEKGETNTYTINVTREKNNDNTLKELIINDKNIMLKDKTFKYDFTVSNEITKVDVKATPNTETSKIEIKNPETLEIGKNILEIIVTAEDDSKQIYKVEIEREKLISNNAYLSDIKIENYDLNFSKNNFKYDLEIKDEKELKINSFLANDKAKLLVTGNKDLKNGSVIKLKITAEDGITTKEYQINIIKKSKLNLPLIGGIIGGIVLLTLIITSVNKSKKKKSNFSNEETNLSNTNSANDIDSSINLIQNESIQSISITPTTIPTPTNELNIETQKEPVPINIVPTVTAVETAIIPNKTNSDISSEIPELIEPIPIPKNSETNSIQNN